MKEYDELKERIAKGWQSWNNESILSWVWMPEGIGIKLAVKDYTQRKVLKDVLIGEEKNGEKIFPIAHSYKNEYTEICVEWFENILRVKTSIVDGDLVMLIIPEKRPMVNSSLIIEGISLWNRGGIIRRQDNTLLLEKDTVQIPVYLTAEIQDNILFVASDTPYLAAEINGPIALSMQKQRTLAEVEEIIEHGRKIWEKNKEQYGELEEAYNAMQTCQAWDTIYNPQRNVPITTVSRIWNKEWGGYVIFCWDTYFAALMQALDNKELAYCNAIEITHTLTERGFVPNFATQDGVKSFDRSQPPVGSMTALMIYKKYQEKWFLQEVYDDLITWNEWYIQNRRTKYNLLAWGSTPYISRTDDYYDNHWINERQGAAFESGLDNSPMYDDIPFDRDRHILLLEDVGLVGLYIKDCYSLAEIAEILGDAQNAEKLTERAHLMENSLEQLWDEETGMYLNRREDTKMFEYRLSPFHFHALFSKKAGRERAKRILEEHLLNEKEFWGEYVLPSIARNDRAYPEQTYWRGRIWAPMNFLVYMAIREYEFPGIQQQLSDKSIKLLLKEWLREGHVHENYDSENGEGCNSERSDKFYHWGGLLAFIGLYENNYFYRK